jgi:excisionase family DNA binding protein
MDEFLTVAEVAELLRLNQQTIRNWIADGKLRALRVGRRVRIARADLETLTRAYKRARTRAAAGHPAGRSGTARSMHRRSSRQNADPGYTKLTEWRTWLRENGVVARESLSRLHGEALKRS